MLARIRAAIVRESDTEFLIDHRVVDLVLEEQSSLRPQVRFVPERENGRTVGIRLFTVRPDTLLGMLGFRGGDRLESINGFELSTPERAVTAYDRLRSADTVEVRLKRDGSHVTLHYEFF
jgi:general secretion pathway protein C